MNPPSQDLSRLLTGGGAALPDDQLLLEVEDLIRTVWSFVQGWRSPVAHHTNANNRRISGDAPDL